MGANPDIFHRFVKCV